MINIVHAWNFMYENDHSYELLLFMYDILNHGYERLLIMDDQYWSVHHIMTPTPVIILTTWRRRKQYKWSRDWFYLCNSLYLTLELSMNLMMQNMNMIMTPSLGASTTLQLPKAMEQHWWKRAAAIAIAPPCHHRSKAQATLSNSCSVPTMRVQGLVGVSPGMQWHQVSVDTMFGYSWIICQMVRMVRMVGQNGWEYF